MMSVISENNQLNQSGTDIIEGIRFATDLPQIVALWTAMRLSVCGMFGGKWRRNCA